MAMIFSLLRRRTQAGPTPAEAVYAKIVAQARRPALYDDLGAPDTAPGRFEMIVLHVALYLRRLREAGPAAGAMGQQVFDVMFASLDAALREMGVGDLTVPKRMKAMARSFYDGVAAYDRALDSGDGAALALELRRIIYRDLPGSEAGARRLAGYALRSNAELRGQPIETLLSAGPEFPPPVLEPAP